MTGRIVQGAILAAGRGARLSADGWRRPKPLVEVGGVPLVAHVLGNFAAAGIRRVAIVFNAESSACADFVRARFPELDLDVLVRSTASSFETLREVSARLEPGSALVSTVDAWCPRADFVAFARAAEAPGRASVLAVTPFVDDDRPLWVRTDGSGRVITIGGDAGEAVTAGMYVFSEEARALAQGHDFPRLRDYLSFLAASGEPIRAISIPKVIDVDRAADVRQAEALARSTRPPNHTSPDRPIDHPITRSPDHPIGPTVWAIYRELAHSPGRETDDAEILHAVARRLEAAGCSIERRTAEEIATETEPPPFLLVMCEKPDILRTLRRWEELGAVSINASASIANTYRNRMIALLERAGVPFPASRLVSTSATAAPALDALGAARECWVKRGDVHNTQAGDVVFTRGADEADAALRALASRGIATAVLQRHVSGDLIKFYGVGAPSPRHPVSPSSRPNRKGETPTSGSWFHHFYHRDQRLAGYAFDAEELRGYAERAAACLGLEIYGGDAIVTERGEILVIDVNAWPSFALYRETAADQIAAYATSRFAEPVEMEASE